MPYKDAERSRAYQREYRRTRRVGDDCTTPCTTPIPIEFRLKTASDVLQLIEQQVVEVQSAENANKLERARCIGYLAGIALKAIDAGNLAGRIESLEAVMKHRKDRAA